MAFQTEGELASSGEAHRILGPAPQVSASAGQEGAQGCVFLMNSQVNPMPVVQGPHFENQGLKAIEVLEEMQACWLATPWSLRSYPLNVRTTRSSSP